MSRRRSSIFVNIGGKTKVHKSGDEWVRFVFLHVRHGKLYFWIEEYVISFPKHAWKKGNQSVDDAHVLPWFGFPKTRHARIVTSGWRRKIKRVGLFFSSPYN
jgi:hypothetical protein